MTGLTADVGGKGMKKCQISSIPFSFQLVYDNQAAQHIVPLFCNQSTFSILYNYIEIARMSENERV